MPAKADLAELEERTRATERLLSTLIAILSAREPRLLQELQAVFESPDFAKDEAGRAASSTWMRSAVTQHPRPGSCRLRSGTTAMSGPTTKRIWQWALARPGMALTGASGLPVLKASTSKLHQP